MPHITACQLVKYLSFIFLKVHTYFVGAFITGGLQNDTGPRKEIAVPPTLSQEEKMLAPLQSFDLSAQAQCSSLKNTKQGQSQINFEDQPNAGFKHVTLIHACVTANLQPFSRMFLSRSFVHGCLWGQVFKKKRATTLMA